MECGKNFSNSQKTDDETGKRENGSDAETIRDTPSTRSLEAPLLQSPSLNYSLSGIEVISSFSQK
jgi:hypothetical protein